MLNSFFASLGTDNGQCLGHVCGGSDRAVAKARSHLDWNALHELNERLLSAANAFVSRLHGRRVVAADARVLMPALRACHQVRLASAGQRLFALYLLGAELCRHVGVYGVQVADVA